MKLEVTKKSTELVYLIYEYCNKVLPVKERYSLWSQMTRCAVSIPSNIVEGQQKSTKEWIRHLRIAKGSLAELDIQYQISLKLYNKTVSIPIAVLITDLYNMISKLISSLITKHESLTTQR